MKRAERLARHYIRAADLRAIYVATVGGAVKVGMTCEPAARARDLRRQRGKVDAVLWCVSAKAAQRLIAAVAAGGTYGRARGVIAELKALATEFGVRLVDDATIQARAAAVVADIDRRVSAMQSSGHLRGLNAEYREARAEASRRGVPFHSYGDHLERYKIRMLYELARLTR